MSIEASVGESPLTECSVCKTHVIPDEAVPTPRGTVCIWCHNIINRWDSLSPLTREAIRLGARLVSPRR